MGGDAGAPECGLTVEVCGKENKKKRKTKYPTLSFLDLSGLAALPEEVFTMNPASSTAPFIPHIVDSWVSMVPNCVSPYTLRSRHAGDVCVCGGGGGEAPHGPTNVHASRFDDEMVASAMPRPSGCGVRRLQHT